MLDMGFIHDIRRIVTKLPREAPDAVLLGDHAARDRRARQPHAQRSGARRGDAGRHHGRDGRAAHRARRPRRQARRCSPTCCAARPIDRALVFTRTKHGADQVVRGLDKVGHRRRGDPRQQVAGPARARARRLPRRQGAHAGRDRHRRARHRRRRHHPRRQLRPAERPRELRAPHRPHRARRRRRHRDLVLRRARSGRSCATSRS